jgi:MYXO-CTERM domain-containing protein
MKRTTRSLAALALSLTLGIFATPMTLSAQTADPAAQTTTTTDDTDDDGGFDAGWLGLLGLLGLLGMRKKPAERYDTTTGTTRRP